MPFESLNVPLVRRWKVSFMPFVCENSPFVSTKRNNGFTLVELVVTISIALVIAAVAVPNLRPFILNGRITSQSNGMTSDIQIARSEAIKRASRVAICTSTAGVTCDGGGWGSGRLVFDATPDGSGGPTPATIIRFHDPLSGQIVLDGSTNFPDPIFFNAQGVLIQSNGRPLSDAMAMPIQFALCDEDKLVSGRLMALNGLGQLTTTKFTCV